VRRPLRLAVFALVLLLGVAGYAVWTAPLRAKARWRSDLAERLEKERALPPARRAGREPVSDAELFATIDSALSLAPSLSKKEERLWFNEFYSLAPDSCWSHGYQRRSPGLVSPELVEAGSRMESSAHLTRAALRCMKVARAFDAERLRPGWKHHHADDGRRLGMFFQATAGFALEAFRDLEEKRPDEAAGILADLWQLSHELGAREGLFGLMGSLRCVGPLGMALSRQTIARLDPPGLESLDRRLGELDASEPSFSRATRRDRLVLDVALRDAHFTELSETGLWSNESGWFASLGPLRTRRELRVIDAVDGLYDKVWAAAELREPWETRAALERLDRSELALWGSTRWELSCASVHNGPGHEIDEGLRYIFDHLLIDRAELRLARTPHRGSPLRTRPRSVAGHTGRGARAKAVAGGARSLRR